MPIISTQAHTHTHSLSVVQITFNCGVFNLRSHLRHSELHVALTTADPHITKQDITDLYAAMFLRTGSYCVGLLYTTWCRW